MTGGFKQVDAKDSSVQEAARFAAQEIGKGDLVSVSKAEQQVVAGMNYRITMRIKHSDDGAEHEHEATVYRPLPHTGEPMSLSNSQHKGMAS
mmetsp:Transcript_20880/g.52861  ORF Transcript_20880/g.52861 Transcript_20880/m.52861 type:complete len:92 (+) Transcript_20880:58-333(+)